MSFPRFRVQHLLLLIAGFIALNPLLASAAGVQLNGAGSSFDYPLFSKAFSEYTKINPDVQINYQSIGSGNGVKALIDRTEDFGATDVPMTDEQLQAAGDAVLHIPVTLGAVGITYNLPSLTAPLNLDGPTLANIFLGNITKWNDDAIVALNPGVDLPDTDVAVVVRSDGSGTTGIFSTFLSSVSDDFKTQLGFNTKLDWPVGVQAKGSEGVAGQVKQIEGGITYVELSYATQNSLSVANIQNSSGAFVAPSGAGATACANAVAASLPDDLRLMIAGCTGDDPTIYPISGFSWIIMYTDQVDAAKGPALVDVVAWLITDGQQYSADLDYAPLPDSIVQLGLNKLATVTGSGAVLRPDLATPAAAGTPSS